MAGYWVVRGKEIRDADALMAYGKLWPPVAKQFGAELIAGKGKVDTREGETYTRQLIVRFDSYEQALACYDSAEYAPLKKLAQQAYDRELVILEG